MDILAALPKTPGMAPEALWAWLKRNGKVHPQELIRYKTTKLADPLTGIREKYAACNCTACGESWHTTIALPGEGGAYPYFDTEEGPRRNGETIHCPNCGTAALAATAPALTQQEVFNRLTNNGQLQGLYMSDGKLYINAQYIAAGRIASVDGKSYFDLNTGNAVLRGSFSTLERTNSTGTYRVFFDSGNIACQKKNGDNWDSIGFLSWNYGISPPETWIKASRVDVLNSLDTPGVWLSGTGWGKTLYAEGGLRRLDVDNINGYNVQWYWDSAISKWVLAANA